MCGCNSAISSAFFLLEAGTPERRQGSQFLIGALIDGERFWSERFKSSSAVFGAAAKSLSY
jgi:hypothetical protein